MFRFVGVQSFFPASGGRHNPASLSTESVPDSTAKKTTSHHGAADAGYQDPELHRVSEGDTEQKDAKRQLAKNEIDADERVEGIEEASSTPPSRIMGRFQSLKALRHPNIIQYIEVLKGRRDAIFVTDARHSQLDLSALVKAAREGGLLGTEWWEAVSLGVFRETASALAYLHDQGMVHRCVQPEALVIGENGHLALADCGLFHMTGQGRDVGFVIGSPEFSAPEVLLASMLSNGSDRASKTDVWSLGAVLFYMLRVCLPWYNPSQPSHNQDIVSAILEFATILPPQLDVDIARSELTIDFAFKFLGGVDEDVSLEAGLPPFLHQPSCLQSRI
eukprot:2701225-Rhodomonas_salina.2